MNRGFMHTQTRHTRRFAVWLSLALVGLSACGGAPAPTPTPSLTPSPVASETPYMRPTLPPTWTPAVSPTPEPAPSETPVVLNPLTGVAVLPPLTLSLPPEWGEGYDTVLFEEFNDLAYVPIALYQGPVTGGTGTIVLVWNFRSIMAVEALGAGIQANLWLDGLRLLRLLVFDSACNIGTAPERDYSVGGLPARGAQFSAVDCPNDLPDTRGWFATLAYGGFNFAFYLYTDPIEAMSGSAAFELQAILDSVRFAPIQGTPSASPSEAPPTTTPSAP